MSEKIRQILVIVSTIGVIFVNYLATTSQIGGVTPSYISEKYPTFITPAGYAFSIWGLIYLGMIAFSIYQVFPSNAEKFSKIRTFYIISCLANISWIYAWHYEQLLASLFAMLTLLASLAFINIKLMDTENVTENFLAKLPFSIYFGWVTVATILNVTILLASFGIQTSNTVSIILACILVAVATVLGAIIRQKVGIIAYPITIAWAVTAIAVKQSGKTALIFVCAFAVMILILSALSFVLKDTKKFK